MFEESVQMLQMIGPTSCLIHESILLNEERNQEVIRGKEAWLLQGNWSRIKYIGFREGRSPARESRGGAGGGSVRALVTRPGVDTSGWD